MYWADVPEEPRGSGERSVVCKRRQKQITRDIESGWGMKVSVVQTSFGFGLDPDIPRSDLHRHTMQAAKIIDP